jgi:hypothetical protein
MAEWLVLLHRGIGGAGIDKVTVSIPDEFSGTFPGKVLEVMDEVRLVGIAAVIGDVGQQQSPAFGNDPIDGFPPGDAHVLYR